VTNRSSKKTYSAIANAEGIFRLADLPNGSYEVVAESEGKRSTPIDVSLQSSQAQTLVIRIEAVLASNPPVSTPSGVPGISRIPPESDNSVMSAYPGLRSEQTAEPEMAAVEPIAIPTESENFEPEPYRWTVAMPEWDRYGHAGDYPYVQGHWYDPYNRNKWKGDYPIFGQQWFFKLTGASFTGFDLRRLPTPSGESSQSPNSAPFFGNGEQAALDQTFFFSFDLSHGDTAFRPADFRLRFTPAVNLNYLQTQQRGIVNINVDAGTNRFDAWVGLQEGFAEFKLHDFGPNFDFISVRAGIQEFNSDFRGFIFADSQPGIRLFGNLRSNRINYNLAYFYMLEKDTNSGLNTFQPRNQQVAVANVYIQDSFAKGYTSEFSFLFNQDRPDIHYDKNGFLVRPSPIGVVESQNGVPIPHEINAYYLGWTGNGHIKRLNVSNAFYQVLGTDSFNPIAGRPVNINGQMAALELSVDKDWLRFYTSVFYASGDGHTRFGNSRADAANGFDSIVDETHFAGTQFSFFDREGIRLTSTGVGLTNSLSLLASLRSSKQEGQASFVNPGVRIYNAGVNASVTPKLDAVLNASYLQFDNVQSLQLMLFQPNIHRSLGVDLGTGINYRPPLSENIVLTAGFAALVPGTGFQQVYQAKTLLSGFAGLRLQF
jgi:hypothetical protein